MRYHEAANRIAVTTLCLFIFTCGTQDSPSDIVSCYATSDSTITCVETSMFAAHSAADHDVNADGRNDPFVCAEDGRGGQALRGNLQCDPRTIGLMHRNERANETGPGTNNGHGQGHGRGNGRGGGQSNGRGHAYGHSAHAVGAGNADDDGDGIPNKHECDRVLEPCMKGGNGGTGGGEPTDPTECYEDADGDGFGSTTLLSTPSEDCDGANESTNSDDCNDTDPTVYPGALETPNNFVDEDCNGVDAVLCYPDNDGDGFGAGAGTLELSGSCDSGFAPNGDDCNDDDPETYPGAPDPVGDFIDQDCDGVDG